MRQGYIRNISGNKNFIEMDCSFQILYQMYVILFPFFLNCIFTFDLFHFLINCFAFVLFTVVFEKFLSLFTFCIFVFEVILYILFLAGNPLSAAQKAY